MTHVRETRYSCSLDLPPATHKLAPIRGILAAAHSMESTQKLGIISEKQRVSIDRRLAVAPMMEWTDRHCRYFHRLFIPHALLYTEMVVSAAIVRGNAARLLEHDAAEHPVALQLGGCDPDELAQ